MAEFNIPEPKKVAPELTLEQRQNLAPMDLLVQYIMPKLVDRQNMLEWRMKKELHKLREYIDSLEGLAHKIGDDQVRLISAMGDRVYELELRMNGSPVPAWTPSMEEVCKDKPERKTRSRKAAQPKLDAEPPAASVDAKIDSPVQISRIADYNSDTDTWDPKVIDGTEITGAVVEAIAFKSDAFPMEVAAFVYDLSDDERKALCDMFPAEPADI